MDQDATALITLCVRDNMIVIAGDPGNAAEKLKVMFSLQLLTEATDIKDTFVAVPSSHQINVSVH